MWDQRQRHNIAEGEDWFAGENQLYLRWFHKVARTRLWPTAMEYNMEMWTQMRRTTTTSTLAGAISQSVHLYTTTWYSLITVK
ncbi:hypothetical protein HU200_003988 [Digitaria exilis]|uniref:Uncharacterized protein n=1 Tax=Digitaria exilis TaxID=1010633 RepID=A0A835FT22_9POAL|nr:hypothetical protein HU200_003988 [Digitaria exilis]